ncbi:MAG: NADH-quinone oxidoreductase subunit L [Alphaproteobacteria bacterium MarineAlpha9_Bin3]|nr:MAG: NADH-quinone oxidoreductase subunit L [Alphaproteobacteria bacterium MarineAlpha9_Bin3]|tara:strand:+ start:10926 stop:12845 length:1920 start_codon:yes stop_codon:yes gene_type:complete
MLKLLVFLPLMGSVLSGLFPKFLGKKGVMWLPTLFSFLSLLFSIILLSQAITGESYITHLGYWVNSEALTVSWSLRLDVLSAVMLFVVMLVSSLVHLYSIGYMDHDEHKSRFFSYLSLFTFAMLMLVTSNNFLQLFFGWEGVGLCSYLLIGFWFKKQSANAAAIKAFIVNRVGDLGLILGICIIYKLTGSLDFDKVFEKTSLFLESSILFFNFSIPYIELACFLLFIGAMGKSAQIGLHTWLADAMEGPTPVSALIHAATMVTAGVFLVARCSPLFEYAPVALNFVILVGAITSIFAACIAITQNDIKKIIAYSTCSQLGYMFFACGVSAYSAGMFHLMTHAFFKALLFLGAGSVIHALSDEQDIRKMGGLAKVLPYTCAAMWIGSLALAGLPPFAGFFSKDIILEAAWGHHSIFGYIAFYLGLIAAFLTAFYSWKILFMVFHGKPRTDISKAHESPLYILIPLLILSIGAIISGWLGYSMVDTHHDFWLESILILDNHQALVNAHHVPLLVKLSPIIVAILGIYFAWIFYIKKVDLPKKNADKFPKLYNISKNKFWFDEIYDLILTRQLKNIGNILWTKGDIRIIDRFGPNGIAYFCSRLASKIRSFQSGYVYHYAFTMFFGLIILFSWQFLIYFGWL